ncbi:hypothetical protein ACFL1H_04550 [Nanoarchaeota archaeon]
MTLDKFFNEPSKEALKYFGRNLIEASIIYLFFEIKHSTDYSLSMAETYVFFRSAFDLVDVWFKKGRLYDVFKNLNY